MKKLVSFLVPTTLMLAHGSLYAAGLGQQSKEIEEIVITGASISVSSARSAEQAIVELQRIPGGIGLVRAEDYLVDFTQSIGDALEFTPGVFADTSAQRENRISIRGSGANATFERRGITVLRDGVPISRASGITEYQEIDPLSVDYIEVYKGSNGLRYGAASLGGAINVVTPTGLTTDAGSNLRLEGGSFDTYRASVNTKGKNDNIDYYGAVTKLNSNGFREHAEVDSIYSFGNIGIKISDLVETRFYLTALQDNFELAGSLTRDQIFSNTEQSPDVNKIANQDRNLDVFRLSNKTVFMLDSMTVETGAWVTSRELDHAITPFVGIIDQKETETGLSLQLDGSTELGLPVIWTAGAGYAESENDARVFGYLNRIPFTPFVSSPAKGALTSEDDQEASNTVAYGQLDFELSDTLNLIVSSQYVRSTRDNKNIFNANANDDVGGVDDDTGSLTFEEVSGRVGLLYALNDSSQLYFNISEGYEPPGISDLTSGGADPFTKLEAQESLTVEVGSRGRSGIISWDAAIYRSKIDNEFVDVARPGFGGTTTNTANATSSTVHQGLELGIDVQLLSNVLWRNIFTYNDFSFDNNENYANNTLPGIPKTVYVSELKYTKDTWYAGINVRHLATGAYADYANTERSPGYNLVDLNAGIDITDAIRIFASAENIIDEVFISNVSTVANLATASSDAVFTPGEGRAFYIGISADF